MFAKSVLAECLHKVDSVYKHRQTARVVRKKKLLRQTGCKDKALKGSLRVKICGFRF